MCILTVVRVACIMHVAGMFACAGFQNEHAGAWSACVNPALGPHSTPSHWLTEPDLMQLGSADAPGF